MLPDSFIELLSESLGSDRCAAVAGALEGPAEVSVRVNPAKMPVGSLRSWFASAAGESVPWSAEDGFYLTQRPQFGSDPMFHCGTYYVQEASSMYVGGLIGKESGKMILDLCAAPGGKSTHILSKIGPDQLLVANEVISSRAGILADNIARWGSPNVIVTNNDPSAFASLGPVFDLVLVDAPCSGEGMFRKEPKAVREWSPDGVKLCASRQRRILADVWPALRTGGTIIYSTCTFNHFEDDDNVEWICSSLGAELISQRRFLPGIDRGEGFFCAVLRKTSGSGGCGGRLRLKCSRKSVRDGAELLTDGHLIYMKGDMLKAYPENLSDVMHTMEESLKVIHSGVAVAVRKGRDLVPEADLALSQILRRGAFPEADLDRETISGYILRQNITLEGSPRGFVLVTFDHHPLGFAKNLGTRVNNLYHSKLL